MQRLGSRVEQPFLCKLKLLVSLPLLIELGSSIQVVLAELEHVVEEDGQCAGYRAALSGTEQRTARSV
jgi:hypothetical protein